MADYVQIGQRESGKATLYVAVRGGDLSGDVGRLFDLTNVDVDFEFKVVDKPIRTAMGKLKNAIILRCQKKILEQ